jgi:hypothetical protein
MLYYKRIPCTPSAHRQSSPMQVQKPIYLVEDKTEHLSDPWKKRIRKIPKTGALKNTKEHLVSVAKVQRLLVAIPKIQRERERERER